MIAFTDYWDILANPLLIYFIYKTQILPTALLASQSSYNEQNIASICKRYEKKKNQLSLCKKSSPMSLGIIQSERGKAADVKHTESGRLGWAI